VYSLFKKTAGRTLNNEKERAMMEKFGFGDPDNYIKNKVKPSTMLI